MEAHNSGINKITKSVSKQRILIVDDVPENIDLLREALKEDYVILAANNGESALQRASRDPIPDIILLDIMMPEMDQVGE